MTSHPVEAHTKCFGAFLAHISGEDAMVGCVVSFYWSGRLRVDHFNQSHADGNIMMVVEEYCSGFSLSGRCHDGADSLALGEDWSV